MELLTPITRKSQPLKRISDLFGLSKFFEPPKQDSLPTPISQHYNVMIPQRSLLNKSSSETALPVVKATK